ncbi:hypothetical protein [Spirosoma flavum]|uniref:Uncharacterized protein n=1 Tax=Spirosoma flavum TaxID=2048557 RepID=A0ABW6AHC8_9BACT
MYLITDDGQATVKLLDEQDNNNGNYQWLDSEHGQPGAQHQVHLVDDSKSSRFLSGGRYLLINTRTVLDVQKLVAFPTGRAGGGWIRQLVNRCSTNCDPYWPASLPLL